jgi:hypothetical protein
MLIYLLLLLFVAPLRANLMARLLRLWFVLETTWP